MSAAEVLVEYQGLVTNESINVMPVDLTVEDLREVMQEIKAMLYRRKDIQGVTAESVVLKAYIQLEIRIKTPFGEFNIRQRITNNEITRHVSGQQHAFRAFAFKAMDKLIAGYRLQNLYVNDEEGER